MSDVQVDYTTTTKAITWGQIFRIPGKREKLAKINAVCVICMF